MPGLQRASRETGAPSVSAQPSGVKKRRLDNLRVWDRQSRQTARSGRGGEISRVGSRGRPQDQVARAAGFNKGDSLAVIMVLEPLAGVHAGAQPST